MSTTITVGQKTKERLLELKGVIMSKEKKEMTQEEVIVYLLDFHDYQRADKK